MHRIFIDCDVILDIFTKREPFYYHSARLLAQIEKKKILGFTSSLAFANINYILRKQKTKSYALQTLRKLRIIIGVLSVSDKHVDQALNSNFSDFEDALQFYSTKSGRINAIITRNKKHYKPSTIAVFTPKEYLAIAESGK